MPWGRTWKRGDHPDLDGGKRTYVLWSAYRGLDAAGRRALVAALRSPVGIERRRILLGLIRQGGAIDWCRARLDVVRRDAITALNQSPLTPNQRRQYVALAGLFGSRPERTLEPAPSYVAAPLTTAGVPPILDNGVTVDAR